MGRALQLYSLVYPNDADHSTFKDLGRDKVTVTTSFLDHLISDLSSQFSAHVKQSASIQKLLPVNINPDSNTGGFEQAASL